MVITVLLLVGLLVCAFEAIHSRHLLIAAIWLAGASAFTAGLLYQLNAPISAMLELSVGIGLVSVLFIYTVSLAPPSPIPNTSLIPRLLAGLLVMFTLAWLLLGISFFVPTSATTVQNASFQSIFWEARWLESLIQLSLIFAGALTILGLIVQEHIPSPTLETGVETANPIVTVIEEVTSSEVIETRPEEDLEPLGEFA